MSVCLRQGTMTEQGFHLGLSGWLMGSLELLVEHGWGVAGV